MKQIFISGRGGPDKLVLREAADPQPQGKEVRIRVKASGINFADIMARESCRAARFAALGTLNSSGKSHQLPHQRPTVSLLAGLGIKPTQSDALER